METLRRVSHKRLPRHSHSLALALAGYSITCTGAEHPRVTRSDSAGVEIIANHSFPDVLPTTADTLSVFGGAEDGPAGFYQVRSALVDVDSAGRIFVLDPSRKRVVAFTGEGEVVGAWGREGDGPGELSAPIGVAVSAEGRVFVHDLNKGMFVEYAFDGTEIDQRPAPGVFHIRFRQFEILPFGIAMWVRSPRSNMDERVDHLLLVNGRDSTGLGSAKPSHRSTAHYPRCGVTFGVSVPLAPDIHWAQHGNHIAVAADGDFEILLYEGTRLERVLRLGEPQEELTAEQAAEVLEMQGVTGPCNSSPAEFIEKHGFYPKMQKIESLALAPNGRIWALVRAEPEDVIVVFDSTGVARATLPSGFPMPVAFLNDGRAIIQVRDSLLGIERVGVIRPSVLPR